MIMRNLYDCSLLYILLSCSLFCNAQGEAIKSFDTGLTITKVRSMKTIAGDMILASSFEGTVLAMDYEGEILWSNPLSGFVNHDLYARDLNGDGNDEILAANGNGTLYCLDHNGEELWSFHVNDAPMYAVCALNTNEGFRIACGGYDRQLYYLSPNGELVKSIDAATYSVTRSFGVNAPDGPRENHITNFLRVLPQADGTEDLALLGANNSIQVKGDLYLFEALADQPYRTVNFNNQNPLGDLKVSNYFGAGNEEILLGNSTIDNAMQAHRYHPANDSQKTSELRERQNELGRFGYRVAQTTVIPEGNSFRYFTLLGPFVVLGRPDFEVDNAEIIPTTYAYNDLWHDHDNEIILLASAQSGGSAIHLLDYQNPNWKTDYQNLQPPGKIEAILDNSATLRAQLANFEAPAWEREPKPVYFVSDLATNTEPSISDVIDDLRANYASPVFLGYQGASRVQDPADWNRDTMSDAFYRDTRDGRRNYTLTQSGVLNQFTPTYDRFESLAAWGGHGNDPFYYSLTTMKALIDYGDGRQTVFIYPELENPNGDLNYVLQSYLYPLAEYGEERNVQLHLRNKNVFWMGNVYEPKWSRFLSGEFAGVFVPSMEETSDKTQELSLSGRMGTWLSGAVDQWGTRAVPDNTSYDRLRQHSDQQLANHFLRQLVYSISSGATHLNNFPRNREYVSLVWELIAKGALYVPERNELLHLSPVHLGMTEPDEHFLEQGNEVKWLTKFNEADEIANKMVFSRMNGTWPGAPLTDWDFSRYAANETERRLNYIPTYQNGFVLTTPVQEGPLAETGLPRGRLTDHLHPLYRDIASEFITDGRDYLSANGQQSFGAETHFSTVKDAIESAADQLPLTVSGDVGWVVAETAPNHLRLTIIDGGYINPSEKVVAVHFRNSTPVMMRDLLDGSSFAVSNNAEVEVTIPTGLFRFFDIELASPVSEKTPASSSTPFASVSPNPAATQVVLTTAFTKGSYQIFDMAGRRLRQGNIQQEATTISLRDLPQAVFVLKVFDEQTQVAQTLKLIKSK